MAYYYDDSPADCPAYDSPQSYSVVVFYVFDADGCMEQFFSEEEYSSAAKARSNAYLLAKSIGGTVSREIETVTQDCYPSFS